MLRYRLRTLLILLALGPPVIAGVLVGIPAICILVAAVASSFIAASIGTLLFSWRFEWRPIMGATAGGVAGVYFYWIAQSVLDSRQPLFFFQPWPVRDGWERLGLLVGMIISGMIGLALGFLFAGLIRLVYFFAPGSQAPPSG